MCELTRLDSTWASSAADLDLPERYQAGRQDVLTPSPPEARSHVQGQDVIGEEREQGRDRVAAVSPDPVSRGQQERNRFEREVVVDKKLPIAHSISNTGTVVKRSASRVVE